MHELMVTYVSNKRGTGPLPFFNRTHDLHLPLALMYLCNGAVRGS